MSDDRRNKPERRIPNAPPQPSMPRRAGDSGRVRAAIRDELETLAEAGAVEQGQPNEKEGRDPSRKVIALDNVSLAFDEPILQDVSFAARGGETIVVVGESGTGKSTILRLILRLLVPDKGRV